MAWTPSAPANADAWVRAASHSWAATVPPAGGSAPFGPNSAATFNDVGSLVSHELRTPLNAIIGFADLMGRELFGPLGDPRYEDYVRHIGSASRELLRSAEDTLALLALLASPAPSARLDVVNLEAAALNAFAGLGPPGKLKLCGLDDLEALADRRCVQRILDTLFLEAIALCPPASCLVLTGATRGDSVSLTLTVPIRNRPERASVPMFLARKLLEHSGSKLIEDEDATGWRASFVLDRAVQRDFFRQDDGFEGVGG